MAKSSSSRRNKTVRRKTSVGRKPTSTPRPTTTDANANMVNAALMFEVNQAAMAAQVVNFYRRWRNAIIGGSAALLLLSLGFIGFQRYQLSRAAAISEQFYNIITATQANGQPSDKAKLAQDLSQFALNNRKGAGSGYGALAGIMALNLLQEKNSKTTADNQKAAAELTAQLRTNPHLATWLTIAQGDEAALRSLLTRGEAGNGAYQPLVALALADRLTQQGKKSEAKQLLQDLAKNNQTNPLGLLAFQLLPAY